MITLYLTNPSVFNDLLDCIYTNRFSKIITHCLLGLGLELHHKCSPTVSFVGYKIALCAAVLTILLFWLQSIRF